jgi:hypothetical protein
MSCARRKNLGSGYSKTSSEQTIETVSALKQLVDARAAQDAKLFPPLGQTVSVIQRTEPPDLSNSLVSTSIRR